MQALHVRVVVLSMLTAAFGCAASGPSPLTHSVRRIPLADVRRVLEAAQAVLLEEGYQLDPGKFGRSEVHAVPSPLPRDGASGWEGARLGSAEPLRRVVSVRVDDREGPIQIFCRAAIERRSTEAYRLFDQQSRSSDKPTDTPIDRDAATTEEQNQVWTLVRRDKLLERRILAAILERVETQNREPTPALQTP